MSLEFLIDGEGNSRVFLFAHGAGAPMDSAFMNVVARELASRDVEVVRFEFPYMRSRRRGERRPPDREATLLNSWREAIDARRDARPLFIGGKSMGGRFATMIADEARPDGVVCFGYPFHPPGNPAKTRTAHLETLQTPALFVQGTRDTLGSREDVKGYTLSPSIRFARIEGGDHSLSRGKKDGGAALQEGLAAATTFIISLSGG
jgi:predicted alpha/beta-hydrolase family hydrolase